MSELIDRILDEFKDINYAYNDSTRLDTLSRMLDELVEQAASPWHRVEEELPSMDGYDWVLGIVTGEAGYLRFHKAVMMVSFDPQYKEWFIDDYPDARITVSHWMLLPEPPKEEA